MCHSPGSVMLPRSRITTRIHFLFLLHYIPLLCSLSSGSLWPSPLEHVRFSALRYVTCSSATFNNRTKKKKALDMTLPTAGCQSDTQASSCPLTSDLALPLGCSASGGCLEVWLFISRPPWGEATGSQWYHHISAATCTASRCQRHLRRWITLNFEEETVCACSHYATEWQESFVLSGIYSFNSSDWNKE